MDFTRFFERTSGFDVNSLHEEILKFTLSLYNNPLLSRKAVNSVIAEFTSFISKLFVPFLQSEIENQLKYKIDDASRSQIHFIFENSKNIFNRYSTEHLRFKIYEQEAYYIPPELYSVEDVSVAYVSLVTTLKKFFSMPGVFEEIESYTNDLLRDTSTLSNIIQGELWQKKYKTSNKIVRPIYVYSDNFETRNPLRSHAGEEKLCGLYASLAYLPPHIAAKLYNIFICAVVQSKKLKKLGPEKIKKKNHCRFKYLGN